jgi:hypothetical protein
VESARQTVIRSGLSELIADLETFQGALTDGLKEIDSNNQHIQTNARRLVEIVGQQSG